MKAVIYSRISPRRNLKNSKSIESQVEMCKKYADATGKQVVKGYSDTGISGGSTDGRDGLKAAIEHCCRDGAVLIVYEWDRLARNLKDLLGIMEQLHDSNASLASVTEQIDTSTAHGKLIFSIMGAVAEFVRRNTAHKTKEHMLELQASGKRVSYHLPYGWEEIPDSPVPDGGKLPSKMRENAVERAIIDEIVEMYNKGLSLRSIARFYNDRGIDHRGGKWYHAQIANILKREGVR